MAYYFLYFYNSIKVYKVLGKSENFNTNNGLFFVSKENLYFSLSVESENNYEIDSLTLKYKTDELDELILQTTGNNFYIVDSYGYNEYFNYDNIVNEKGTFYLEIEYDEKVEFIDLSVVKQYENSNLLLKKQESIVLNDGMTYTTKELFIPEKVLSDFAYYEEGSSYSYQEEKDGYTLDIAYFPDAELLIVDEVYDSITLEYLYYFKGDALDYFELDKDSKIISNEFDDEELHKYFIDNYNEYLK